MELDKNEVYWVDGHTAVMIHLSNNPTGLRNHEGHLLDNIQDEGWALFKGEPGKMEPVKELSEREALNIIERR